MKITYLFHHDAANPAVQSGRPASILEEFLAAGVDVEPVFPLTARPARSAVTKKIYYRFLRKHYRGDREPAYLEAAAQEFKSRTEGLSYDLVFSPGSEMVSRIKTDRPITFCADATFANMVDYYWDFTNLSAEYIRKGHEQEAAALSRAALAVYPSKWAADSAINDYGADPDKVAIIPFGANLGKNNTRAEVAAWIKGRTRDQIRLLFVGRHWDRKGGELVVDTAYCLIKLGHNVVVDVVGCEVPVQHRGLGWINAHGKLSPRIPGQMERLRELFIGAHYVFIPSRAEAYGLTFAEANAFGVPAVATATGGIPGVIRDGENGHLLSLSASGADYADVIAASFSSEERYRKLCLRSFLAFEERLNWKAFTRRFLELAQERCSPTFARTAGSGSPFAYSFAPPRTPLFGP